MPSSTPLPKNWTTARIADVASVVMGQSPPSSTYNSIGDGLPFFQGKADFGEIYPSISAWCAKPSKVAKANDILLSVRAPVGSTNLAPSACCIGRGLAAVRPDKGVSLKFLLYALRRFAGELDAKGTGTTFKAVSSRVVREFMLPIPPHAEQVRIANFLDGIFADLDAGIAALQRCQEKLGIYRASLLKAAVEGDLTADWRSEHPDAEPASKLLQRILAERRERWEQEQLRTYAEKGKAPPKNWKAKYKEPVAADQSDLPSLPTGWEWATLDQLAAPEKYALTDGPFGSNLKTSHYTASGPRVIRLQNIGDGEFLDAEAHISRDHFQALKKYEVRPGDVVFAALGNNLPRSCVLPDHVGPAIVKADCVRFRPSPLMSAACINYFVNANPTRHRAKRLIHGVGRPRLNLRSLRTVAIPVSCFEEQCAIAEAVRNQLAGIQQLETTLAHKLAIATTLRQSVLHHAFSGKLVPQNPNDEPASKLLERIANEREARQRKAKRHRNAPARAEKAVG